METPQETLSDTALKLLMDKVNEQPYPEVQAVTVNIATHEITPGPFIVLN